ncbi:MAG: hypothetical protein GF381_03875 [Candidatus Pacebacteria bacterium]|nr:hypothetical protein [Candidatus Paceibacterota bacterium]
MKIISELVDSNYESRDVVASRAESLSFKDDILRVIEISLADLFMFERIRNICESPSKTEDQLGVALHIIFDIEDSELLSEATEMLKVRFGSEVLKNQQTKYQAQER